MMKGLVRRVVTSFFRGVFRLTFTYEYHCRVEEHARTRGRLVTSEVDRHSVRGPVQQIVIIRIQ